MSAIRKRRQWCAGVGAAAAFMAAALLLPARALAVQAVPSDDAYIEPDSSSSNFGSKEHLSVSDGDFTSFLRFDLSTLPDDVTGDDVVKATLKLFLSKLNRAGSLDLFEVTGP